jgi:hypothetical protein
MSASLYKALTSVGVKEDLAEKASSEVISFDRKIDKIEGDFNKKHEELRTDIKVLATKLNIVIGLMSASFVMVLGLFIQSILK